MKIEMEKVVDNYGSVCYWARACGERGCGHSEETAIKNLERDLNKVTKRYKYMIEANLAAEPVPWYIRLVKAILG